MFLANHIAIALYVLAIYLNWAYVAWFLTGSHMIRINLCPREPDVTSKFRCLSQMER
jgi:hypothetical protein